MPPRAGHPRVDGPQGLPIVPPMFMTSTKFAVFLTT